MLKSLGRVFTPGSEHTTCDFCNECYSNCVCCVVDPEYREERCLALTTVDPNSYDWFDCGHVSEAEMENPQVRYRRENERWVRRLLFVAFLIWGAVGVLSVFNPTGVMFNVVVDEEYRARLEEGKHMKDSVAQLEAKKKEEELGANVITNFLNELLRSDKASDKDKTAVMHVLELASEKMQSAHCAAVVVTAPIKVYGATCLFYALLCMFLWFEEVRMNNSITNVHLTWYICSIIGYALATTGHGHGLESSAFTLCMLAFNAVMAFGWILVREWIMRYTTGMAHVDLAQQSTKPV